MSDYYYYRRAPRPSPRSLRSRSSPPAPATAHTVPPPTPAYSLSIPTVVVGEKRSKSPASTVPPPTPSFTTFPSYRAPTGAARVAVPNATSSSYAATAATADEMLATERMEGPACARDRETIAREMTQGEGRLPYSRAYQPTASNTPRDRVAPAAMEMAEPAEPVIRDPELSVEVNARWLMALATDVEDMFSEKVADIDEATIGMRQVAATLKYVSDFIGIHQDPGTPSPAAQDVIFALQVKFQDYSVTVTDAQQAADMQNLAVILEKRADIANIMPNIELHEMMNSLADHLLQLVSSPAEMVTGMREVAAMLEQDFNGFDSGDGIPTRSLAAQQVHRVAVEKICERDDDDLQKLSNIRALAKIVVESPNAYWQI
ncbi:uncharacterized protein SEPMUDRAFT_149511 [Sphaerulina musiva SO2202]|uniref:Uncharacterized protein n=1 Tax=Sphaerulina musiva (strain SO2202) TaxID=692275 RepID=M3AZQ8_SPHMS|nr:uncharacterized protein SEPMUDRAFT_149511 [Sphaerulina musiva SO2202]EMF13002.1 hypothetical protein SEPMUDRAFT_149511 [Sphaerulina musiva SO2202]